MLTESAKFMKIGKVIDFKALPLPPFLKLSYINNIYEVPKLMHPKSACICRWDFKTNF
jgi:hypothetical protein